ncbi:MAG: hypothetical protein AB1607_03175 [Chloroflexota bacterium]
MNFLKKIPSRDQITPVYAVIVTMIYSWSIVFFFWRLPSLLFYSTIGEIGVMFAYMITADFLDSLIILILLILLCLLLPEKLFFNRFSTKGVFLSVLILAGIFSYGQYYRAESLALLLQKTLLAGLVFLILAFLLDEVQFVRRLFEGIANRAVVFLYLFLPITALSVLTVFLRNLF